MRWIILKDKNDTKIAKNKIPNNKIKNEVGDEYEFSDELFNIDENFDYLNVTGGLRTRKLVEQAEQFLASKNKNKKL